MKKLPFLVIIILLFAGILLVRDDPIERSPSNFIPANGGFSNPQLEKAITDYIQSQDQFSWKTTEGSINACSVQNLDSEKELFPFYVWSYCAEYILEDEKLKTISGSSGPIKISYPNELSFYSLEKFSHEAPRDGSYYSEDIKRIFPSNIQEKIFNFDAEDLIQANQRLAEDIL